MLSMAKAPIWLLAASLALASVAVDAAKMYRWTDANGNPVVSDRPPPKGTPYTEIGDTYTPKRRRNALRETPRNTPGDDGDEAVTPDSRVPALCTRALEQIDTLENAPSVAVTDDAGNVRVLSDDERAAQLANARQMAERHCVVEDN